MSQMGLQEYCVDINGLDLDQMIEKFVGVRRSADSVKAEVDKRVGTCRDALEEQYTVSLRIISAHN
jgi:hypothetical protein